MKRLIGRRNCFASGLSLLILGSHVNISHAFDLNQKSWDQVLKKNTLQGRVDYTGLKENPRELQEYLDSIGSVKESEYAAWSQPDKIAFWINAYNAFTFKAILDHYPIQSSFAASLRFPKNSIRQISGVWDELRFQAMGRPMTLNEIEHETLRKQFHEPRIHMALVCASIGCPPLRGEAYVGSKLQAQLDDQARLFLRNPEKFRIDHAGGHLYLSPIFKWFGDDFVKTYMPDRGFEGHSAVERAVLNFVSRYTDEKDADFLREGKFTIKYLDYDWSLNEQKAKSHP